MVRLIEKYLAKQSRLLVGLFAACLFSATAHANEPTTVTINISVNLAPLESELEQGFNPALPEACQGVMQGGEFETCQFNSLRYEAARGENQILLTVAPI